MLIQVQYATLLIFCYSRNISLIQVHFASLGTFVTLGTFRYFRYFTLLQVHFVTSKLSYYRYITLLHVHYATPGTLSFSRYITLLQVHYATPGTLRYFWYITLLQVRRLARLVRLSHRVLVLSGASEDFIEVCPSTVVKP